MTINRRKLVQAAALAPLIGASLLTDCAAAEKEALRLLVPAYFYPGGPGLETWERLFNSASRAPILAIANPASGPGERADPNYEQVMKRAREVKLPLLGYVNTDYGKRPAREVEADIRRWLELYPALKGFFFDLQTSTASDVPHYAALREHARRQLPGALVVTNPGTLSAEEYVSRDAADIVCVHENLAQLGEFRSPAWMRRYSPERFAGLSYGVPDAEAMRGVIRHARAQGLGYVYITDRKGANPWDGLPAYWEAEVAAVNGRDTPPSTGAASRFAGGGERGSAGSCHSSAFGHPSPERKGVVIERLPHHTDFTGRLGREGGVVMTPLLPAVD